MKEQLDYEYGEYGDMNMARRQWQLQSGDVSHGRLGTCTVGSGDCSVNFGCRTVWSRGSK